MPLDRAEIQEKRNHKVAMLMRYFGISMAIFYAMMAIIVMFTPLFSAFDETYRYILGSILLIYGIYRFFRIFKN